MERMGKVNCESYSFFPGRPPKDCLQKKSREQASRPEPQSHPCTARGNLLENDEGHCRFDDENGCDGDRREQPDILECPVAENVSRQQEYSADDEHDEHLQKYSPE